MSVYDVPSYPHLPYELIGLVGAVVLLAAIAITVIVARRKKTGR